MSDNNTTYTRKTNPGGWVSVDPLPDAETLKAFYADLYYQQPQTTSYQTAYSETELAHRDLKSQALLHVFQQHGVKPPASFLDVGTGEGFLMDAAARAGYTVTGADFSSFGLEKFFPGLVDRLLTGDIFETLETLAMRGTGVDACSLINVLEHVIDPQALLTSLRRVLAPNGLLAITVPNDYSRLQGLLTRQGAIDREFWFAPPQHLHYFNTGNLPPLCASLGFEVVDAWVDFPIDLYLLHPGSNYIRDRAQGPPAHQARMNFDLLLAQDGVDRYLDVYRAFFRAGIGRDLTVVLRPLQKGAR